MFFRRNRRIPVNSSKRNTYGVRPDGTPIISDDEMIKKLIQKGLIEVEPMSVEQQRTVHDLLKGVEVEI